MMVERKELKSLTIDLEKGAYLLNGEDMTGISRLDIEFDNGKWTLLVTKNEIYAQTVSGKTTV